VSTHSVEVVEITNIQPHPNADRLELVQVGNYTCVVEKGKWHVGDKAAYVEPDYVVPDLPDYAFLLGKRRIGAKRLRGVWSEGLLVAAPEGSSVGENVLERLGITRYEPSYRNSEAVRRFLGPPLGVLESVPEVIRSIPKYDLENLKKYRHLLKDGEPVYVTEKLHGTNARYIWHEDRLFCGSRTQWRKAEPTNVYWETVKQHPWIEGWCKAHPGLVLWGEIYGDVQDMNYGASKGQYEFRVFDIYNALDDSAGFRPASAWMHDAHLRAVPVLAGAEIYHPEMLNFDFDKLVELAEKDSAFGGVMEGLVVQPVNDRYDSRIGRVKLKLVSRRYLSRP
jgi:RNA ligase (TIGR02306 family)